MKLYKFTFKDFYYDEYDSFVLLANSRKEVVELVKEKIDWDDDKHQWEQGYTLKEIRIEDYKKPEILLASYNAG